MIRMTLRILTWLQERVAKLTNRRKRKAYVKGASDDIYPMY